MVQMVTVKLVIKGAILQMEKSVLIVFLMAVLHVIKKMENVHPAILVINLIRPKIHVQHVEKENIH